MSKLSKLLKSPGAFFRDALLKRFPEDTSRYLESPVPTAAGNDGLQKNPFVRHDELDLYRVDFPVDVVITWVDDTDDAWIKKKTEALDRAPSGTHVESLNPSRFRNRDELRYVFRALDQYAPWVNHIFLVTDGQRPAWLHTEHPKVTLIDHRDLIPPTYLPTFNSHVIEAHLHRIPGLSEHYVYFNDDVILARPVPPEHFFAANGDVHIFHTFKSIPTGAPDETDTPVDIASKNARQLVQARFGKDTPLKVAHSFHPQLRSVQEEMSTIWPERFAEFFVNRFRGHNDIPIVTYLFPYFAYLTRRATIRQTSLAYFSIKSPVARRYYEILESRRGTDYAPYAMCLNDTDVAAATPEQVRDREEMAGAFLARYFPIRSAYERPDT